jgi:hypothetical protein
MALIFRGSTPCSICGNVIANSDNIVATSHFIGDENDPLWRFSDSAMHRTCFLAWDLRQSFVATFNEIVGPMTSGNGTYHEMQADGRIESKYRDEESRRRAEARKDTNPNLSPLSEAVEAEIAELIRTGPTAVAIKELYERTGWNAGDCVRWVHERKMRLGPQPPPCPHCGVPLRTALAKQCVSCGMDWHDPANLVRLGPPRSPD